MKGPVVDQLVYDYMFPKPRSTDPPNFQGLLQRQLVPEVRLETQAFYGHLTSQEAKYPGLDYSYQPHRTRLSRYPWHRRLFRAFDNLGLTHSEIAGLTKWEGTRWAKERFEREQGITIRDTTSDGISDWIEPELRSSETVTPSCHHKKDTDKLDEVQVDSRTREQESDERQDPDEDPEDERDIGAQIDDDVNEESDAEIQSIGLALNQRLRAAVAQREAGNPSTVMDEEWEQWFKEAVEAGGLPFLSSDFSPRDSFSSSRQRNDSQSSLPARLFSTSRVDQWHRIPDATHSIVRHHSDNPNSTSHANDGYSRRIGESFSSQRQYSSSPLNRGTTMTSTHAYRSNTTSSPRRSYLNPAVEMNSRIRQWDAQRTSMRATSNSRPNHTSTIRSTLNRPPSNSVSYST